MNHKTYVRMYILDRNFEKALKYKPENGLRSTTVYPCHYNMDACRCINFKFCGHQFKKKFVLLCLEKIGF